MGWFKGEMKETTRMERWAWREDEKVDVERAQ